MPANLASIVQRNEKSHLISPETLGSSKKRSASGGSFAGSACMILVVIRHTVKRNFSPEFHCFEYDLRFLRIRNAFLANHSGSFRKKPEQRILFQTLFH